MPASARSLLALVQRVPLGVVVAIPPYNYPLNLAVSKVPPPPYCCPYPFPYCTQLPA